MRRTWLFWPALAATCTPWLTAPVALLLGVALGLLAAIPAAKQIKTWQARLLQTAVVLLGASMNLTVVARVGSQGIGYTAAGIAFTLLLTAALARLLRTDATTALLVGVGTAICGGSAIAAVGPAVDAKPHALSIALAIVFLLNAAALFIFPAVGAQLAMSQGAFGLWSALAIHDTSSVVGAAAQYGPEALAIATTVKLARALWILPLTALTAWYWRRRTPQPATVATSRKWPWFIAGFVAMAALFTWLPAIGPVRPSVVWAAKRLLVVSLFLVGAGVTPTALRQIGVRPLVLGLILWACVAALSLFAITQGYWTAPRLP